MGCQWEFDGIGIYRGFSGTLGFFIFFWGISMGIWDLMGINRIYRDL
jgi:hypothetical protein